jgi:nucleoside-diphosphate-sugar epimerase
MRPSARIASAVTSARAGGPRRSAAEHVVFGAGAVGLAIADALLARGVAPGQVRVVNHSGHASLPAGVQSLGGDASDPAFAVHAAAGARVVYQVLNAPYHRWARDFPPLQHGVIAAAAAAGARLVTLENLYAYGAPAARPDGATAPFTEDSPLTPHTRKGAVRAQMHAELMGAHAAGRVEVTVGRASDYFGPRGGGQAVNLGDQAMRAALAGRPAQVLGDPDQPHTYSYIPDIAAGLAILGEHPDAPGKVWHLPNDPRTRTTRQLLDIAYQFAGQPRARLQRVPVLALRGLGLFRPGARETIEMLYEFDRPFVVDSSHITALGAQHTPVEQALEATLAAYR